MEGVPERPLEKMDKMVLPRTPRFRRKRGEKKKKKKEGDLLRRALKNNVAAKDTLREQNNKTTMPFSPSKAPSSSLSSSRTETSKNWITTYHKFAEEKTLFAVLDVAMRKFSWSIEHPVLSIPDPRNKEFQTKIPTRESWPTLSEEVKLRLGLRTLSILLESLHRYVKFLFSNGVEYHLNPEQIFPFKAKSREAGPNFYWGLFLGNWSKAEFHPNFPQRDPDEWERREKKQLDKIERIFEEARQLRTKFTARRE